MSCATTQSYALDCADNRGGVVRYYLIEYGNVTATNLGSGMIMSANPTNPITSITLAGSTHFRKYEMVKETVSFTDKPMPSTPNGTLYSEQECDIQIRKLITNWRNEIYLLCQNRLQIIAEDRNGKFWFLGYNNGLDVQPSESGTGTKMGDFNGYKLKLKGMEEYPAIEVTMTQAQLDALVA